MRSSSSSCARACSRPATETGRAAQGASLASLESTAGAIRAIPALTGLRFLAAMLVLLYHYGATWSDRLHVVALSSFLHNGYLGVSVFFVLSGFILTHVHQEERIDHSFLVRFYQARFARLYPVYALALLIALPVMILPLTGIGAIRTLLMVQSWTMPASQSGWSWIMQAWTLSVELFLYLSFPPLLYVMRQLPSAAIAGCILLCAGLILAAGLPSAAPGTTMPGFLALIPLPLLRWPEFVLGMALRRTVQLRPQAARALGAGAAGEILVLALLVLSLTVAASSQGRALVTLLTAALIVQLYEGRGPVSRLLAMPVLQVLGGASYALYLLEQPIRNYCEHLVSAHGARFASPVATVLLAVAVYRYWEQPMRRWLLARMQPRLRAQPVPGRPA